VLDALIIGMVMSITDAVFGFERPNLDPNNRQQALWRLIERLPSGQRSRIIDLSGMVSVFAEGVNRELDYTNEAYHMIRVADSMATIPGTHVPAVYRSLSTARVLTMEFVEGVKISQIDAIDPAIDRVELARTFMRAMMKQIIVDGFFHADPHPGNLFIAPASGLITFLDFGLIGELRQDQRLELFDLLTSLQQFDTYGVARAIRRLSVQTRPINEVEYQSMVTSALMQNWKYSAGSTFGAMINKVLGELARNGLRMNRQLTLAVKAIAQTEEATAVLAPDADLFAIVVGEVQSLVVEQLTPEYLVDTLQVQAIRAGKEVLRRMPSLPDATLKWLDQYQAGKLKMEIDTGDLGNKLDRLVNSTDAGLQRLAVGMILAGMLIGSALGLGFFRLFEGVIWEYIYGTVVVAFLGVLLYSAVVVWVLVRSMRVSSDRT
jgi:ubiquinone biosynthesis protein